MPHDGVAALAGPCARPRRAGPRSARRIHPPIVRHAAGSRWPDQDQNAVLTGLAVWRGKDPGTPGGLHGTGWSPFPHMKTRNVTRWLTRGCTGVTKQVTPTPLAGVGVTFVAWSPNSAFST